MGEKLKNNADLLVAAAAVLVCLGLAGRALLSQPPQRVSPAQVKNAAGAVRAALNKKADIPAPPPSYAGIIRGQLGETEANLPPAVVAWVVYPMPPAISTTPTIGTPPVEAALRPPAAAPEAVVSVGRAQVTARLGEVRYQKLAALQLWRRKEGQDWPEQPLVTVTFDSGGKAQVSPADAPVSVQGGAFTLNEEKLLPRTPYEYRARVAASFLETVPSSGEPAQVLPPPDAQRQESLDKLLGGAAYVTDFTPTAQVRLPGDVQVLFAGQGRDEAGGRFAYFRLRRWLKAGEQIEISMTPFRKGQPIKASQRMRIDGKLAIVEIDAGLTLLEVKDVERIQKKVDFVMKPDPQGGPPIRVEKIIEVKTTTTVAMVKDEASGKESPLDLLGASWWPALQVTAPAPAPAPAPAQPAATVTAPKAPAPAAPRPPVRPVPPTPTRTRPPAEAPEAPPPPPPIDMSSPVPIPLGTMVGGVDISKPPESQDPAAIEAWRSAREEYVRNKQMEMMGRP